jgi:hypothetical protein
MQREMNQALDTIKTGTNIQKAGAIGKLWYTLTDYTRRTLSALDQASSTMAEQYFREYYGAAQLRQRGMPAEDVRRMFLEANATGAAAAIEARSWGYSDEDARMHAVDATRQAFMQNLETRHGKDVAGAVMESAQKDAEMVLGLQTKTRVNPVTGKTEDLREGIPILANYSSKLFRHISSLRSDPNPGVRLAGLAMYGFVEIPYRITAYTMYWSPIGAMRWSAKKFGKLDWWQQSMATEAQMSTRLAQSLAGTFGLLALGALMSPTSDGDDDKDVALHITGEGPDRGDKAYRDAWLKSHRPWSVEIKVGDARLHLPYGRGTLEFLKPMLAMLGAMDDAALAGKHSSHANYPVELLGSYVSALWMGPSVGSIKSWARGLAGGSPAIMGSAAYAASSLIPFSGAMKGVERVFTDPPDRSSVSGAIFANLPVFRSAFTEPAINALGDPIDDTSAAGKAWYSGSPLLFRIPENDDNKVVYGLIMQHGQGPPTALRSSVERRYGPLSNEEWTSYMQIRGGYVKKLMLQNAKELGRMDATAFDHLLTRWSQDGAEDARRKLRLRPIR